MTIKFFFFNGLPTIEGDWLVDGSVKYRRKWSERTTKTGAYKYNKHYNKVPSTRQNIFLHFCPSSFLFNCNFLYFKSFFLLLLVLAFVFNQKKKQKKACRTHFQNHQTAVKQSKAIVHLTLTRCCATTVPEIIGDNGGHQFIATYVS